MDSDDASVDSDDAAVADYARNVYGEDGANDAAMLPLEELFRSLKNLTAGVEDPLHGSSGDEEGDDSDANDCSRSDPFVLERGSRERVVERVRQALSEVASQRPRACEVLADGHARTLEKPAESDVVVSVVDLRSLLSVWELAQRLGVRTRFGLERECDHAGPQVTCGRVDAAARDRGGGRGWARSPSSARRRTSWPRSRAGGGLRGAPSA